MLKRKLDDVVEDQGVEVHEEAPATEKDHQTTDSEDEDRADSAGMDDNNDNAYPLPALPTYLTHSKSSRPRLADKYQNPRKKRNTASISYSASKPMTFGLRELPRSVTGIGMTPSWFRYANIDGPSQHYTTLPEGYEYDVQYYRLENGNLSTNPALTRISPEEGAPLKKLTMSDIARGLGVQAEITDEGIEDVSSDDEFSIARLASTPASTSTRLSAGRARTTSSNVQLSDLLAAASAPSLAPPSARGYAVRQSREVQRYGAANTMETSQKSRAR